MLRSLLKIVVHFVNNLLYLNNNCCFSPPSKAQISTSGHSTHSPLNRNGRGIQFCVSFPSKIHAQGSLDHQTGSFSSHALVNLPSKLSCNQYRQKLKINIDKSRCLNRQDYKLLPKSSECPKKCLELNLKYLGMLIEVV